MFLWTRWCNLNVDSEVISGNSCVTPAGQEHSFDSQSIKRFAQYYA